MFNYAVIIRKAVESDAPAIHEIMQDSFEKYMRDSNLTEPLEAMTETVDDILADIWT